MHRRTDLTDGPHDPTPCSLDATLCNRDPTLHRRGRTCLSVELTERLVERTSRQSTRTAPARHDPRGMSGVTVRARRHTPSTSMITPRTAYLTALPNACHAVRALRHRGPRPIHGLAAVEYSAPPFAHRSLLDDHDRCAPIHVRFMLPYGLSPVAHAWYDDSHIIDGRVHAMRAERTEAQPRAPTQGRSSPSEREIREPTTGTQSYRVSGRSGLRRRTAGGVRA
jgi:hypothetical protein